MYYALKDTARLQKQKQCVVLFCVEDTGSINYIHPLYALLLALCDGEKQETDLLAVLEGSLGLESGKAKQLWAKFQRDYGEWFETSPVPTEIKKRYQPADFIYKTTGRPGEVTRLEAPIDIAWLVTERCPYDCLYCCVKTLPASSPAPDELSTEEAFRFLEDCARTGVTAMTLYGGEPFLRKDLPDLIAYLLHEDIHVSVSTKMKLPERVVRRLAEGGLKEIQVSIDSPDPELADRMVGSSRYLEKAFWNLEVLRRYGLEVTVNAVTTRETLADLPELIRVVGQRGAAKVTLSGYLRSYWKHDDGLFPGREALLGMRNEVLKAGEEAGVEVELYPMVDPRQASLGTPGYSSCSGKTGLAISATGRASFCDRLLPFDDAVVGNVKHSTLMEIWNGEGLQEFLEPPDASLAGTACAACGLKAKCNDRLRCAYRTFLVDHRLQGPDYLCHIVPEPPVRFF